MWTTWWLWALIALILGILEVVAPTYILLGFAIGAGLVALGLVTGLLGAAVTASGGYGFAMLSVVFAVLSLLAWLSLRAVFGRPEAEQETFEEDIND